MTRLTVFAVGLALSFSIIAAAHHTFIVPEKFRVAPGEVITVMFLKSIVLAGTPNDGYKHAVGTPIEIIPERDPAQVKAGETLPVRVLVKGKPMAGLQVFAATAGAPAQNIGKTDANGRIAVTVKPGPWRLHTIHMERVQEEKVDWESFWTTLTFEIR